jgi:hypothetical protein
MGARVLLEISKQAARLHHGVVERGELGFRQQSVFASEKKLIGKNGRGTLVTANNH